MRTIRKINGDAAGPKGPMYSGHTYTVEDEFAAALVAGRYAEYVADVAPVVKVEAATVAPEAEQADARPRGRKSRTG